MRTRSVCFVVLVYMQILAITAVAGPLAAFCEDEKLRAAGRYFSCLSATRAQLLRIPSGKTVSDTAIARCDRIFDAAFRRAEANGSCRTAGGPSMLRDPIKAQWLKTAEVVGSGAGCQNLSINPGKSAECVLSPSTGAIDLAEIIAQINDQGGNVSDDTVYWMEAWGGGGGKGFGSDGGSAGSGGYAQTTATVSGYRQFFGTSEVYYYLGVNGTHSTSPPTGGDGGTATVLSANDIFAVLQAEVLPVLIAAGGGGGGAGNSGNTACGTFPALQPVLGGNGGAAASAIANSINSVVTAGARGSARRNTNHSGFGGGGDFNGTGGADGGNGSKPGGSGFAPLGGEGGNHTSGARIGFSNRTIPSTVTLTGGGTGGPGGDDAPGGGGGGGWGAGGGGSEGDSHTNCVSGGGGGGGSLAIGLLGTAVPCTAAPAQNPGNPAGGGGYARITFDLGACD